MINRFELFQLKENPFRITPPTTGTLIWAGFEHVKQQFTSRIQKAVEIPNNNLVLNWGEYGSGKTHSARYFSQEDVLRQIVSKEFSMPFSMVINMPKGKKPVEEIYTKIIDCISISKLRARAKECNLDVVAILPEITDNLFIRTVLSAMFKEDMTLFKDEMSEESFKEYLYGNAGIGTYKKLMIQRSMSSDSSDYVDFIAALFSLITYNKQMFSCVILWFDEFEDISLLTSSNISNVNAFIRTLIDKTRENLLVFLNLTQSAMMKVEDLGEYLIPAVKSRIKERIELKIPSRFELKDYLVSLLNSARTNEKRNDFSPFEEKVVDCVCSRLDQASLRKYNEAFSQLLEEAAYENVANITEEFYNNNINEIFGLE